MNAEQAFQQALSLSKKYTAETMQGAGAIKGDPGENGISPIVSITNISGGHKITITDVNGANSFDVMDGNADIAQGTIGMFAFSGNENIQKDSVLNVPKTQIVGHAPIKYPGQIYDIYAGIIWYGKEIYFTSFIIQEETGELNLQYKIKLMSDPKKLTGNSDSEIPTGAIIIWNGAADNIPSGWHICDGTDGTPDLTDKFVLGAGEAHSVGSSGGEEEHTLTVNEIPAHSHQQRAAMDATHTAVTAIGDTVGSKKVNSIKTDVVEVDTYSPLTTISVGGGQPHNNMPPYYTLCYIMKVS